MCVCGVWVYTCHSGGHSHEAESEGEFEKQETSVVATEKKTKQTDTDTDTHTKKRPTEAQIRKTVQYTRGSLDHTLNSKSGRLSFYALSWAPVEELPSDTWRLFLLLVPGLFSLCGWVALDTLLFFLNGGAKVGSNVWQNGRAEEQSRSDTDILLVLSVVAF